MSCRVVLCCVVLCCVVLCCVMSCRVVSCRVVSCPVVSCRVVSCRCVVLCCVVLCCVVLCCVMSCRVVSCRVVSCPVVSCRVVSCRCVVLCCVVLCRVVLCCVVLCCVVLYSDDVCRFASSLLDLLAACGPCSPLTLPYPPLSSAPNSGQQFCTRQTLAPNRFYNSQSPLFLATACATPESRPCPTPQRAVLHRSLGLWAKLRSYQQEGVRRALELGGRCMLADEMGLGKTLTALATVAALDGWPCLAVVPAVTRRGWAEEAERWLGGVLSPSDIHVIYDQYDALEESRPVPKLVLVSPKMADRAHQFGQLMRRAWRCAVLDEAHTLTASSVGDDCDQTKTLMQLIGSVPRRLLLTGRGAALCGGGGGCSQSQCTATLR